MLKSAMYSSFCFVSFEAYRLELGVTICLQSGHVALEVMVDDCKRYFLSELG
jgi:hypothetical protein